jgi:hypothetical protein
LALLSIQSDNKPRPQLEFKAAGAGGRRVTAQGLRRPEVP